MSKAELLSAADTVLGGEARDQSTMQLQHRMTVAQFVTDLCLNEIENRGALKIIDGEVGVPYHAEHWVDTVLTRPR